MLKTVKNRSGIWVDPPPVFSKFPHIPILFFWKTSLILLRQIKVWKRRDKITLLESTLQPTLPPQTRPSPRCSPSTPAPHPTHSSSTSPLQTSAQGSTALSKPFLIPNTTFRILLTTRTTLHVHKSSAKSRFCFNQTNLKYND